MQGPGSGDASEGPIGHWSGEVAGKPAEMEAPLHIAPFEEIPVRIPHTSEGPVVPSDG